MHSVECIANNEEMFHLIDDNCVYEVSRLFVSSCKHGIQVKRNSEELNSPGTDQFLDVVAFLTVEFHLQLRFVAHHLRLKSFHLLQFSTLRQKEIFLIEQRIVQPSSDFPMSNLRHFSC